MKKRRKSKVLKRSIAFDGHKTSISLEEDFWTALKEIAATRNARISELVATVDRGRKHANLSSSLRLYVLDYYQQLARK
jgi:predicted DNA-binding ribbon-helix-helix protein